MQSQSLLRSGLLQLVPHHSGRQHRFQHHGSCSAGVWVHRSAEVGIVQWLPVISWSSYIFASSVQFSHMHCTLHLWQGKRLVQRCAVQYSIHMSVVAVPVGVVVVVCTVPWWVPSVGVPSGLHEQSWSFQVPWLPSRH